MAVGLGAFAAVAGAQTYPERPIKLIVGFAAGGPTDVIARVVAEDMSATLGQTVLVENRPGGTASVATEAVAAAPPDGYTLLFSSVQLLINPILHVGKSKYDPFKSFAPVSNVASLPMAVVTATSSPLASIDDIVSAAKARPGEVFFGSSGNGSAPHLAAATLQVSTGTQMTNVPFRGNGPALTEVMAGRVSFMFYPMVGIAEQVAAKRLKVLAVGTEQSHPDFPGTPTVGEAGYPGLKNTAPWVGMVAPGGTPAPIVSKLSSAVRDALQKPKVRERLEAMGANIIGDTPREYAAFLKSDYEHWSKIIKAAGVKAD